jgi:response regulator RpfG family c-di-GMP phosphodiesterase
MALPDRRFHAQISFLRLRPSTRDNVEDDRGSAVALFLAAQRMPGMTGTQFLERAAAIYPDAKKVLLTAHADTDAAKPERNAETRTRYAEGGWSIPKLARQYGISNARVRQILKQRPDENQNRHTERGGKAYTSNSIVTREGRLPAWSSPRLRSYPASI